MNRVLDREINQKYASYAATSGEGVKIMKDYEMIEREFSDYYPG